MGNHAQELESYKEQISMLQDTLKQKCLELSDAVARMETLEKSTKDTTDEALEELKANHASELESYVDMCSGLNNQLSTLSEELSEQAQINSELENQIEQLTEENAQQNEAAMVKTKTLQDENANLVSKLNDIESKVDQLQQQITEKEIEVSDI